MQMPETLGLDLAEQMGIDAADLSSVLAGRVRTDSPKQASPVHRRASSEPVYSHAHPRTSMCGTAAAVAWHEA